MCYAHTVYSFLYLNLNKKIFVVSRGGVEDTRLEAKDTKKSKAKERNARGQGPRTQMQVFSYEKWS